MLKIDKNFEKFLLENKIEKVKLFFYKAGCAELKLGVEFDNFDIDNIENFCNIGNTMFFTEKENIQKFENATITRIIKADHTGIEKIRYLYSNIESVKHRCGCGSSFSFESKKIKLDLNNLKNLKEKFLKK